jgi:hypothetical protein
MIFGTADRPLTLNYNLPERSEFKKIVKNGDTFFFKDRKSLEDDTFILNLISNPHLTKSEVLIGSYLHHRLTIDFDNELIFWTSETEQQEYKYGGEDGCFWAHYNGEEFHYETPFPNLLKELSDIKVNITKEVMITALKTLHKYHYITMTTKQGKVKDPEVLSLRSEYRHIRLYDGMRFKPMHKFWLDPTKVSI